MHRLHGKKRRRSYIYMYIHGPSREDISKTNTLNIAIRTVNGAALLLSSHCYVRRHRETGVVGLEHLILLTV